MTYVDYLCRSAMLRLVYNWAKHGGRYVQLMPANFWHGHANERKPWMRPGSVSAKADARQGFTSSRRKWMLDTTIRVDNPNAQPQLLRYPEVPYSYRMDRRNDMRAMLAARIMNSIRETGDVCAATKSNYWLPAKGVGKECGQHCVCKVISTNEYHRHRCEHGEWRHN